MTRRAVPILLAALILVCPGSAQANPTAPQVVSGAAAFAHPDPQTLQITNSANAIINWGQFSIPVNEITRFVQPSAASAVLNRVVGADPSAIMGQLHSNGHVFLINPNGMVFGSDAVIDTAGFTASTLNISDENFLQGRLEFTGGDAAGEIVNQGFITAGKNGDILLIAPNIVNSGTLHTEGGNLLLAAGRSITITSMDVQGLHFEIQAPDDSVVNLGRILAENGAAGIFAGTLRNDGEIMAGGASLDQTGTVVLHAAQDIILGAASRVSADGFYGGGIHIESDQGTTFNSGLITAAGLQGTGGDVVLLGDRVALIDAAQVDASGAAGGGTVLVGGDYQGCDPGVHNARRTYVGPEATISADATQAGDGGRIIVWSDEKTGFYGSLSARGGPLGGDGGFAEISGKLDLDTGGHQVSLAAPQGRGGTLLYDPARIEIVGNNGGEADGSDANGDVGQIGGDGGTLGEVLYEDVGNSVVPFIIYESEIEGTADEVDIILEATDSITVSGTFGGNELTVDPLNNLGGSGGYSLTLQTRNNPGDGSGGIDLTGSAAGDGLNLYSRGTGDITIITGGEADIRLCRIATSSGNVEIVAGGDLILGTSSTNIYASSDSNRILLKSTNGSVLGNPNTDGGEGGYDVRTIGLLEIEAATGIGKNGGGAFQTRGGSILFHNTSGDVWIANSSGPIVAGSNTNGNVYLDSTSGEDPLKVGTVEAFDGTDFSGIIAGGDVSLRADEISITQSINAGTNRVWIGPMSTYPTSPSMSVGGFETLDVSQDELNLISAGTLTLGTTPFGNTTSYLEVGGNEAISASVALDFWGEAVEFPDSPVTSSQSIRIVTDSLDIGYPVESNMDGGSVIIRPLHQTVNTYIGNTESSGLKLLPAEIQLITADNLEIGDNTMEGDVSFITPLTSGDLSADQLIVFGGGILISSFLDFSSQNEGIQLIAQTGGTLGSDVTGTYGVNTGSGVFYAVSGAGLVNTINSPSITAGSFQAGTLNVNAASGTVTLNAPSTITDLDVSGGTLFVDQTTNVGTLQFSGGLIRDTGNMTVSGSADWTGGTFTGSGQTAFNGGLDIDGAANKFLFGHTLVNNGTLVWSGTGSIGSGYGAIIENPVSSLIEILNDGHIDYSSGGGEWAGLVLPLTVNNAGTLVKSSSAGTSILEAVFNNSGTVRVQTGTLSFSAGSFNQSSGVTELAGGNIEGPLTIDGGLLTGSGTISGNVAVSAGTIAPGASPGLLVIDGDLSLSSESVLDIEIQGTAGYDQIQVAGTLSGESGGGAFDDFGTLNIVTLPGYSVVEGDTFTIITAGSGGDSGVFSTIAQEASFDFIPAYDSTSIILNLAGIYNTWIHGTDGSWAVPGYWSFGTVPGDGDKVRIIDQTSTVSLTGGTYAIESLSVSGGNRLSVTGGSLTLSDASTIDSLSVSGGMLVVLAGVGIDAGELAYTGGSLQLGGTATVDRLFSWNPINASSISGAGTGVLNLAGAALFSGDGVKTLNGVAVHNAGDAIYSAGTLTVEGGAVLDNTGLLEIQADLDINAGAGGGSLVNAGVVQKSAGAADASVALPLTNTGLVEVDSGSLTLGGGSSSSGEYAIGSGARLELSGAAAHTITGVEGVVTGAGTLSILAGATLTLENDGPLSAAVSNSGILAKTGSGGASTFNAAMSNSGSVIAGSGRMVFAGSYSQSAGVAELDGGDFSGVLVLDGGMLTGSGTVFGDVVNNAGTIAPGASAGILVIDGDLELSNAGTLEVEIGGLSAGVDYDQVQVTGTLSGAGGDFGTLSIIPLAGYSAAEGDGFTLITAGSGGDTGAFATILQPESYGFVAVYSPSAVELSLADLYNIWILGSDGFWGVGGNWSLGRVPDRGENALIKDGTSTVTLDQGSYEIGEISLYAGNGLVIEGGGLSIGDDSQLEGALRFSGGQLTGAGGLTVLGAARWEAGTHDGSGVTRFAGGLTLDTGADKVLGGTRQVVNTAEADWLAGDIVLGDASRFDNQGTLTATAGGYQINGAGGFANSGTLNVVLAGAAETLGIGAGTFDHSGLVDVQSGVLELRAAGGTYSGDFDATGALLRFVGGDYDLSSTVSLTGDAVRFDGAAVAFESGATYEVTGATRVSAGAASFAPGALINNLGSELEISGGSLELGSGAALSVEGYTQSGGILGGTDGLTVTGAGLWQGGAQGGSGVTTFAGGLTLDTAADKVLGGTRQVVNTEDADWLAGDIVLGDASRFVNQGTLAATAGGYQISGTGGFANSGTLNVDLVGAADTLGIGTSTFENSGLVDLGTGILETASAFSNAGTLAVAQGAVFSATGSELVNSADGLIRGTGTIRTPATGLVNQGVISPGDEGPGILVIDGDLELSNAGTLEIEIKGLSAGIDYDQVQVTGTLSGAGGDFGTLSIIDLAGYSAVEGDGFTLITAGSGGDTGAFSTVLQPESYGFAAVYDPAAVALSLADLYNIWILGGDGFWGVGGNWSLGRVPDRGENAVIKDGTSTVTLDQGSYEIGQISLYAGNGLVIEGGGLSIGDDSQLEGALRFSGGQLTGAGELTVLGAAQWEAGTHDGSGVTTFAGGLTLDTGADKVLGGTRQVVNTAEADWLAGDMVVAEASRFENQGTLTATAGGYEIGGTGVFTNSGTLNVVLAGAADTLGIGTGTFDHSGLVDVQSGVLELSAAGGAYSGDFDASGALLRFVGGDYDLSSTVSLTGDAVRFDGAAVAFESGATYEVTGATRVSAGAASFAPGALINNLGSELEISGGSLELSSGTALSVEGYTQSGGILDGTDGLTVTGAGLWQGGAQGGSGVTTFAGGLTLDTAADKVLGGTRQVVNTAVADWLAGDIVVADASRFENQGTLTATASGHEINGTGVFANSGTLNVVLAGAADTLGIGTGTFDHRGLVDVQSGVLELRATGGTYSGDFDASGALLRFVAGDYDLSSTVSLTGDAVRFDGAAVAFESGATYEVTGATRVSAGAASFAPGALINNLGSELEISGGSLELGSGAALSVEGYTQSGGILGGTDGLTVTGAGLWQGGAQGGSGVTTFAGGLTLDTAADKVLGGTRQVVNTEDADWLAGDIVLGDASRFVNQGTLAATAGGYQISGTGGFANSGTLNVDLVGAADTLGIGTSTFENSGLVDLGTGILETASAFSNAGTLAVAQGAVFSATGSELVNSADGLIRGTGTIRTPATGLVNQGVISPGDEGPGILVIDGDLELSNAGTLEIEIKGLSAGIDYDQVQVTGTLSGAGGDFGTLSIIPLAGYSAAEGDGFTLITAGSGGDTGAFATANYSNSFDFEIAYAPQAVSLSLIHLYNVWTGAAGSYFWGVAENWRMGTVPDNGTNVRIVDGSSTVNLSGGSYEIGILSVAGGNALSISGGSLTISDSSMIDSLSVTGGSLVANADSQIGALNLSSGDIGGSGVLTAGRETTWSGGTLGSGGGRLVVAGGLSILDSGQKALRDYTLENAATVTLSADQIDFYDGATIYNVGVFDIRSDVLFAQVSGDLGAFFNAADGTVQKTAGPGAANFDLPFDNSGDLRVAAGTLSLNGGGIQTGGFTAGAGTVLVIGGGVHQFDAGARFDGEGTYCFSGGTASVNDSISVADAEVIGGTLKVPGTLSIGDLSYTGGLLEVGGTVSVGGAFDWNPGDSQSLLTGLGTGVLNLAGTTTLAGTGGKYLDGITVNNTGVLTYLSGGLQIGQSATAKLNNAGMFDIQGNLSVIGGAGGNFANAAGGTVQKTAGSGTADFDLPFDNGGDVRVAAGTLALNGGGIQMGGFTAEAGTAMVFGGGVHQFEAGTRFDGQGTYRFSGGTASINSGISVADLELTGGSLTLPGTISVGDLRITGGRFEVGGTATVGGLFEWNADSDSTLDGLGTGVLNLETTTVLAGTGTKYLDGITVNNTGIVTYTGGELQIGPGSAAEFNNAGMFEVQGDLSITGGTGGNFTNAAGATVQKTLGTGTAGFDLPFANNGDVRSDVGTLAFSRGYTQSGGVTRLAGGDIAGNLTIDGGRLTGSGTICGNVAIGAGTIVAGSSTGILVIEGDLGLTGDSVLDIEIGGLAPGTGYDQVQVTGILSGEGGDFGTLNLIDLDGYNAAEGDAFTLIAAGSGGDSGAFSTVNYSDSFDFATGYGPQAVSISLVHLYNVWTGAGEGDFWNVAENWRMGTVPDGGTNVRIVDGTSTVTLSSGSYEIGILSVAAGNALSVAGGSLTILDVSTADSLSLAGGTLAVANGVSIGIGDLAYSGGALQLDGTAAVDRTFAWNPGAASAVTGEGSGILNLAGTSFFSGTSTLTLDGITLNNTGDLVFSSGSLVVGGVAGALFNNPGQMEVRGDLDILDGGGGRLVNAGTLQKNAGAADSLVSLPLSNSGAVRIDTGSLTLAGGSTSSGQYVIAPGGLLQLTGATPHDIAAAGEGSGAVSGGGALGISADATLSLGSDVPVSVAVINAGTLTKTGGSGASLFSAAVNNSGNVVAASGTMAFSAGYTQTGGLTQLAGGDFSGDFTLLGGLLSGEGTLSGNLENLGGTVSPGASPGILTVGGDYTQGADAVLSMEIGGFAPGNGFDRLTVSGAAVLDGTLDLTQYSGFISNVDDRFEVMTYDSLSGDFAAITADGGFAYNGLPGVSGYVVVNTLSPIFTALTNGYLISEILSLEQQNQRSLAAATAPFGAAERSDQEIQDEDAFRKTRLICR